MWLPKDERRLLAGYYRLIGDVGVQKVYREGALSKLFRCCSMPKAIPEYGESESNDPMPSAKKAMQRAIKQYIDGVTRVEKANNFLSRRGFVKVISHQHEIHVTVVELTLEGFDLGRRYSTFLSRSGLWFAEHREHWLWLLVAFIGGGLVSKLLDILLQGGN